MPLPINLPKRGLSKSFAPSWARLLFKRLKARTDG